MRLSPVSPGFSLLGFSLDFDAEMDRAITVRMAKARTTRRLVNEPPEAFLGLSYPS